MKMKYLRKINNNNKSEQKEKQKNMKRTRNEQHTE